MWIEEYVILFFFSSTRFFIFKLKEMKMLQMQSTLKIALFGCVPNLLDKENNFVA